MNNEQNFPNCMRAVTIICESTLCGLTSTTTVAREDEAVMYEEVNNLDGSKARCSKHNSTTPVITNTKRYAQCHNI